MKRHRYKGLREESPECFFDKCANCGLERRRQGSITEYMVKGVWQRGLPLGRACPNYLYAWNGQPQPRAMEFPEYVARVDRVVEFAFVHILKVVQQIHQKWRQEMRQ